jgi:hypothetical protein
MIKYILFFFFLLFAGLSPAIAGKLFPPENSDALDFSCPNGKYLLWDGASVKCGKLVTSSSNCAWVYVQDKSTDLTCPTGKYVVGIGYEASMWTMQNDSHSYPEVDHIKCCKINVTEVEEATPNGTDGNDTITTIFKKDDLTP